MTNGCRDDVHAGVMVRLVRTLSVCLRWCDEVHCLHRPEVRAKSTESERRWKGWEHEAEETFQEELQRLQEYGGRRNGTIWRTGGGSMSRRSVSAKC